MVKTNAIPFMNGTNGPSDLAADIRAIKSPVAVFDVWLWVWAGLALLAVLALAWWAWRRWRRRQTMPAAPAPVIPPHERARAKLAEALALIEQPRPFCTLVSDTIRIYVEERFALNAPERTTEEFLEELQSSPLLTFEQKQVLGQFLSGCDLVKFARYEPARSELDGIYNAALRLIEETEPPPLPSPAPHAGSAPAK